MKMPRQGEIPLENQNFPSNTMISDTKTKKLLFTDNNSSVCEEITPVKTIKSFHSLMNEAKTTPFPSKLNNAIKDDGGGRILDAVTEKTSSIWSTLSTISKSEFKTLPPQFHTEKHRIIELGNSLLKTCEAQHQPTFLEALLKRKRSVQEPECPDRLHSLQIVPYLKEFVYPEPSHLLSAHNKTWM